MSLASCALEPRRASSIRRAKLVTENIPSPSRPSLSSDGLENSSSTYRIRELERGASSWATRGRTGNGGIDATKFQSPMISNKILPRSDPRGDNGANNLAGGTIRCARQKSHEVAPMAVAQPLYCWGQHRNVGCIKLFTREQLKTAQTQNRAFRACLGSLVQSFHYFQSFQTLIPSNKRVKVSEINLESICGRRS
jgi:hypothetical protein